VVLSKEKIIEQLKTIKYPGYNRDIVSFGMVKDLVLQNSTIKAVLNLTSPNPEVQEQIATLVRQRLESLPEVKRVDIEIMTSTGPSGQPPVKQAQSPLIPEVRYKIAVASGKGGVGKTTVAVNLAVALASRGARVGLLDADIYGPNVPMMLGVSEKPTMKGDKIVPLVRHDVGIMSIGFFLEENTPVIWRGPLVGKAIEQLLRDVAWDGIDYLVIDLPPGTGDAQISLSHLVQLSGSIIVTTPQ